MCTLCATGPHSHADALSRLPLPDTIKTVPLLFETVLMKEQVDKMPFTTEEIKTLTCQDSLLSKVAQFVQSSWPTYKLEDEEL